MRSTGLIPGNPWPHGMSITVEDDAQPLLELLWLRAAWDLAVTGAHVPPALSEAPAPADRAPLESATRSAWEAAWPALWDDVLAHAAQPHDAGLISALHATEDGSPERSALLRRIAGPSWRDRFGREGLTDDFGVWHSARIQRLIEAHRTGRSPEREALEDLVPAWRRGLTKVVVIPCAGTHTRTIGPHALLVTDATRASAADYADALRAFTP